MFKRVIKEETKVPAEIGYLGEMRNFVTRVGRKYGVSERIINVFKLAIDEAGTNIIRHAYRDWEGFITIRMLVRDRSVTISMIDQGHTFDPNRVKDPDLQRYVDIGKKGGLGIFIIRRVIDQIDYRKTVEGNELKLIKNRSISPRKRFMVPEFSFTMKTRFSLIASGVLTSIVLAGFIYSYVQQEEKIVQNRFEEGRAIARTIVPRYISQLEKLEAWDLQNWELDNWELATLSAEFQREYAPLVREVLIVDVNDMIQGAVSTEYILSSYQRPSNAVQKADDVYQYLTDQGWSVYDVVAGAIFRSSDNPRSVGTIHLLLDKSVIDEDVRLARRSVILNFGLILLFGYLGVFLLVYVTMSPFKKLLQWIRALGRDEIHEEMDFDSSDEVGQIAQAFNDITEKFRKSQENLAERERLQKEMQVAQEIQHTLLPSAFPEIEGYEIASYYEAAKEVGGDYFDFVEVDKDTLGIVVADVSGKGVPGSLIMTMIRTALRTEARGNKNAADVLTRVNDFVINDMKRGMFVTIFYIILDSRRRTINYASAGHNPMILYRGKTKKSFYLNPRGFPIGINLPDNTLFRKSIQSDTLRLRDDDILIVYTDGITEAMNIRRERFGDERLLSAIRNFGNLKVNPLVDKIREEINIFTEEHAQSDDITLVAVKEKMKAEDVLFNFRTRLMKMVSKEGMGVKEACKSMGVSTSTYYKYKKRFKKMGLKGLKEKVVWSDIEEKHISIEDKAKIYDIIRNYPEYGAKRISEELNTEKYGNTVIDEKRIYDELVRSRLNTKDLRVAFIERGGRKERMKSPGTPFLTLDGKIIVEKKMDRFKPVVPGREEEYEDEIAEIVATEPLVDTGEPKEISEEEVVPTFDELLHSPEELEKPADGFHIQPEEDEFSFTIDSDQLETEREDLDQRIQESELSHVFEEEEQDKENIRDDSIDLFEDLMVDIDHREDEEVSDIEEIPEAEEILEMEKDVGEIGDVDQVDEEITASIAGELLEEEMGTVEERGEGPDSVYYQQEEAFLEMMEGVGFDRRTVFSGEGEDQKRKTAEDQSHLSKKRFLESGLWFYRQGLFAKAINEFKKAIKEDPAYVEAYQCLGDTFFRLGEFDSAKNAYEKVKKLDPTNESVLENLGVLFANRGDYKRAVWQWGEVLKNNPDREDIVDRIKKMQRVIRQRCL
ncbi:SpoIIE family protein phosphatase [bacterium]|nr:SpoIIE family protein phosphatase [bacterium]RQV94312.1 MAG: tetratricopeptide repeat protein [bacterium]